MISKLDFRKLLWLPLFLFSLVSFAQQKPLSQEIVYKVSVVAPRVLQTQSKDSIAYDFLVDKRFFWQMTDAVLKQVKEKKLYLMDMEHDTVSFDSMSRSLKIAYKQHFKDTLTDKMLTKLFEDDIREIKFQEKWTYNPQTMLINKKVVGYNLIIRKDTVLIDSDDLATKPVFSFDIGWIYPDKQPSLKDTLCIERNLQYTMPIYNRAPYHWWDSHLEAEYSIPYFGTYMNKAESGEIKVYAQPIATDALTKLEVTKRKGHELMVQLADSNAVVMAYYTPEDINFLRFGDQWLFDFSAMQFIKEVNYLTPMIDIIGPDGSSRGKMPLYYVRKK